MSYTLTPSAPQTLIDAQTVNTAQGILLLRGNCERVTVMSQGNGVTSGGTYVIEEAYYDPNGPIYSGTWSAIGSTLNASAVTGDVQLVTHVAGSVWALRVRIATAITGGGTLTVVAWGN